MWKLFIAFTLIPALELYLLITIGSYIGALETVAIILVTGMVGAWLAKREGWSVLSQLSEDLGKGIPPAARIAEGALVVAGGLLLVTPGVLTDLTGFAFIFPITRRLVAPVLVNWVSRNFVVRNYTGSEPDGDGMVGSPPPTHGKKDPKELFDHPVA